VNPYFSTTRQPVGLFPSVVHADVAGLALLAVGLVFAFMVLKPQNLR